MTETLIVLIIFSALFLVLLFTQFRLSGMIVLLVCLRPFVEAAHGITLAAFYGYDINPMSLWAVAVIVMSLAYWVINKKNPLEYKVSKILLLFLVSVVLGSILTLHHGAIIEHLFKYLPWLLLIPVVADITKDMEADRFFHFVFIALSLLLLINLVLLVTGRYDAAYYGVGEFYGYFKNPHVFSYTMLFLSFFALWKVYTEKRKIFPLMVLTACLGFVTFAYVRATWLAFLVGLATYLVAERQSSRKYLAAVLLSLFLVVFIYHFRSMLIPAFQERNMDFQQAILLGERGHLGSGRIAFWGIQLKGYLNSSPLELVFGKGFRYISVLTAREYGMEIGGHNDYIELLLGSGLVGLFCFILFQGYLFKKALYVHREVDPLMGLLGLLLMAVLVTLGFTSGVIYMQSNVYNAVLLGTVVGLAERHERRTAAEKMVHRSIGGFSSISPHPISGQRA